MHMDVLGGWCMCMSQGHLHWVDLACMEVCLCGCASMGPCPIISPVHAGGHHGKKKKNYPEK